MTYQAASGGRAQKCVNWWSRWARCTRLPPRCCATRPAPSWTSMTRSLAAALRPTSTVQFGAPLAGSPHPWIDKDLGNGKSREEWKGQRGDEQDPWPHGEPHPVEGILRGIGAMRFAQQAMTDQAPRVACRWRRSSGIRRERQPMGCGLVRTRATRPDPGAFTCARSAGTLDVRIGRLRRLAMGGEYVSAFTVGDSCCGALPSRFADAAYPRRAALARRGRRAVGRRSAAPSMLPRTVVILGPRLAAERRGRAR